MRRVRLPASLFSLCLALLTACASDAPPPAQPPPPPSAPATSAPSPAPSAPVAAAMPVQLADDTPITTASGAALTVPKGWWLTQSADRIVLEDPERGFKATLLEMPEPDAVKAIDAAWQQVEPGFGLELVTDPETPPPIRGWESITNTAYETKDADQRDAFAMARRYNGTSYVAVMDGARANFARRGAQLETALWTFRPPGLHEESFKGKTARVIDATRAAELDSFIEDARGKLDVVGAAVAVIVDNRVVYEKGFGARVLGKKEPVNPDTLFMMGSISKSMTTMMEAALVDQGKLAWDAPVVKVLPSFALGDADLTQKLQMWHTACACTGMPRRDFEMLFHYAKRTPEETVGLLRTMKPTTGFGETFQYSNLMVAAGGFAAAHAYDGKRSLGDAYDAAMKKTIFEPIGMKSTTLDFAAALRANHAMPNAETMEGVAEPIPIDMEHMVIPVRPAGGVWSNLHDMERYVMTEMADGVSPDGKRVVSEANLHERRKPRVRSGELDSYGLGLVVGTFRDLPSISHDGGTGGFSTLMFMLPEQKIAILSLTNTAGGGGYFNEAIHRKIVEEVFDGARPLSAPRLAFFVKEKHDGQAHELAKVNREPDAAWVKSLAGAYSNADLGKVTIAPAVKGGKGGVFDTGEWKSTFAQKKDPDGTMKIELLGPAFTGLELVVGGDAAHPTLALEDAQVKYVFERTK